jgi:hypothetical protein
MLKIRDDADLKELEKYRFELDGNTYKYFIAKNKCVYVCIHDRKIIRPELPVITSRIKAIFTSKKPYQKLSEIMYRLDKADLVVKE